MPASPSGSPAMRDDQPLGVVGTHQHATTRGSFPAIPSPSTSTSTSLLSPEMVYLVSTRRDGGEETQ